MKDDELLDTLATALAPPPVEPSAAEIEALHRAVARKFRPRAWWQRPTTGYLFAAAIAAAAAVAVVVAPPRRERAVAVAAPDSMAETGALVAETRKALAGRDPAAARRFTQELESRLARLDDEDRRVVEDEVRALVVEIEEQEADILEIENPDGAARGRARARADAAQGAASAIHVHERRRGR
ncbi:MAG: hypothetical protein QM820_18615 [Minicystis sp.]